MGNLFVNYVCKYESGKIREKNFRWRIDRQGRNFIVWKHNFFEKERDSSTKENCNCAYQEYRL
jgi:hypothetical protein